VRILYRVATFLPIQQVLDHRLFVPASTRIPISLLPFSSSPLYNYCQAAASTKSPRKAGTIVRQT
jgi:hypothetical protein